MSSNLAIVCLLLAVSGSLGFDFKCMKPKDPGPCKASQRRYYFDNEQQKCKTFTYGGCQGNENNFETKKECENTCTGNNGEDSSGGGFHCRLPTDPGPCMASMRRYAYDYKSDSCKQFIYGGCEGNKNNFETKKECESACATRHDNNSGSGGSGGNSRKCMLPKDEGPCKRNEERWYFDNRRKQCKRFKYGGCQGNENNFQSKHECQRQCIPMSSSGGSRSRNSRNSGYGDPEDDFYPEEPFE